MLEEQKIAIAHARDKALDQLCGHVAAEAPGVLDQAASALLGENMGFQNFYDRTKPALENYQARKAVPALLNPSLERYAPARFETIRQDYAARIAAVEAQMAALPLGRGPPEVSCVGRTTS